MRYELDHQEGWRFTARMDEEEESPDGGGAEVECKEEEEDNRQKGWKRDVRPCWN